MSEPSRDDRTAEVSMAEVADESAEESVDHEREVVGDEPDVGDLVDEDRAQ